MSIIFLSTRTSKAPKSTKAQGLMMNLVAPPESSEESSKMEPLPKSTLNMGPA